MEFEWDENKSRANQAKHGIDFNVATELWLDENRVEMQTTFPDENRSILIGRIGNKLWVAIFTRRKIRFALYPLDAPGTRRPNFMRKKKIAETAEEFDHRFDEGEDIHDLIDMSKANIIRHGKKVRITLDIAERLVQDIDRIRKSIGVDRAALIKIWLHERVQQEKSRSRELHLL